MKRLLILALCAVVALAVQAEPTEAEQAFADKDYERARTLWEPQAEAGDPAAQRNLALLYHRGLGVDQDTMKASEWYRKAADQGDAIAQYNLGVMYETGWFLPQDEPLAMELMHKAAEQGNGAAHYKLGVMYSEGRGSSRDQVLAWVHFRLADMAGIDKAANSVDFVGRKLDEDQMTRAQALVTQWKADHKDVPLTGMKQPERPKPGSSSTQ